MTDAYINDFIERIDAGDYIPPEELYWVLKAIDYRPLPDSLRLYLADMLVGKIKPPKGRPRLTEQEAFQRDVEFFIHSEVYREEVIEARTAGCTHDEIAEEYGVWAAGPYEMSMAITAKALLGDAEKWEQAQKRVSRFRKRFPNYPKSPRLSGER